MGIACDRFGARPVLRLTTGLAALSMFGLGAAESAYGVLVTTFFVGVGFGGGAPQITTLCVDLFGLRSIGSLMGAILALIGVVGAIGPVFSGWMFDVTNSYLLAYWAGGLILIVCVEISFLVSGRQQWAPAAVIPRSEP
ncbi:MAG: MFS transporter [Pseudomonadota bacterium]